MLKYNIRRIPIPGRESRIKQGIPGMSHLSTLIQPSSNRATVPLLMPVLGAYHSHSWGPSTSRLETTVMLTSRDIAHIIPTITMPCKEDRVFRPGRGRSDKGTAGVDLALSFSC